MTRSIFTSGLVSSFPGEAQELLIRLEHKGPSRPFPFPAEADILHHTQPGPPLGWPLQDAAPGRVAAQRPPSPAPRHWQWGGCSWCVQARSQFCGFLTHSASPTAAQPWHPGHCCVSHKPLEEPLPEASTSACSPGLWVTPDGGPGTPASEATRALWGLQGQDLYGVSYMSAPHLWEHICAALPEDSGGCRVPS